MLKYLPQTTDGLCIAMSGSTPKQGQNLKKSALPKVTNDISYISFSVYTKLETVSSTSTFTCYIIYLTMCYKPFFTPGMSTSALIIFP